MKRVLLVAAALCCLAIAQVQVQAQTAQKIGIVLLHGKLGARMGAGATRPGGPPIGGWLVVALRNAGYLVAAPEMCWSSQRRFDKSYPDCLAEIDAAIAALKAQGARDIVVGGLSLGGNAAIAYGATHPGLRGVIGLGPADNPVAKAHRPEIAASLAKARALIAQGKGDATTVFDDVNTGAHGSYAMTMDTTPRIFLSFAEPDALTNIPANVAKLRVPLLWVAGDDDPTQRAGPAAGFDKTPPNPLNRYVVVHASHPGTPDAATDAVLDWLAALGKS